MSTTTSEYGTDWSNIDLSDGYERDLYLIDPLSFDTLLLEVKCNCPVIDTESVKTQFFEDLENRVREAREVFSLNLDNIVKQARKEREG